MMNKVNDKLYNWASIIDPQTMEQAVVASTMPFIHPHLATMPDAHLGRGAVVGSVIPTIGAIMPAAVGVDIGCFVGETKVPLLDGTQATLESLTTRTEPFWVYSCSKDGLVVPGKATALRTRSDAVLVKVTVSGGDEVLCTPDHQFLLKNGTYREAKDLKFNDSLMPLYRSWQTRDGYESCSTGKVIGVEAVSRTADVYCLQVEEHHNFALAAGVFVHNCGMIAVRTQFYEKDLAGLDRKALRENIERAIPLSKGHNNRKIQVTAEPRIRELDKLADEAGFNPKTYSPDWDLQLGTLGSGNHFIEVTIDEESRVWLFLHSGSRGVGNKIAMHHIKVAQDYCKRHWIQLPKQPKKHDNEVTKDEEDLAYLVEGTKEFDRYIAELRWAQHFALLNREEMMDRLINQFQRWVGSNIVESERINSHHNYTEQERHFGRDVWLSRKGAINASKGKLGLVPGSMGTKSYVVEGLGNPMSLNSSPHGAGRPRGRKQSTRELKVEDFKAAMKAAGVEWNEAKAETFLDESPLAYKDIDVVMEDSKDLVVIKHTLRQIVNVKGD